VEVLTAENMPDRNIF